MEKNFNKNFSLNHHPNEVFLNLSDSYFKTFTYSNTLNQFELFPELTLPLVLILKAMYIQVYVALIIFYFPSFHTSSLSPKFQLFLKAFLIY